jgi:hypothetical protein
MAIAGQLIESWLPLTFAINSINRCVINKDASAQCNEPGGNAAVKGAVFAVTRLPWRKSESAFA